MVNASTPAGNFEVVPSQLEVEAEHLVTNSGVITSNTDFLELISNRGVKIGGADATSDF